MISRYFLPTARRLLGCCVRAYSASIDEEESELISVQNDYFSSSSSDEEEPVISERSPGYHTAHLIKNAEEMLQERHAKMMEA